MTLRVRALSATGDMTFGQGSSNYLINTSSAVAQIVYSTLNLWLSAWFLNLSAGVPWLTILGKGTVAIAQMVLRSAILNVPGVTGIGSLTITRNTQTRAVTVQVKGVTTIFGSAGNIQVDIPLINNPLIG